MPESNSRAILAYLLTIAIFLNILNFKQDNHQEFAFICRLSLSFPRHKKKVVLDFTQTLKKQLEIHFGAICNHDRRLTLSTGVDFQFCTFSKVYLILSSEMRYQGAICQVPNNSFTVEVKWFFVSQVNPSSTC